jgi:hypothetical protein
VELAELALVELAELALTDLSPNWQSSGWSWRSWRI